LSNQYKYEQLPDNKVEKILKTLETYIADFIRGLEYPSDLQYTVCVTDLIDVIQRVDKRIRYYKVFHNMDCNEGKKAALYAYWIAKVRPIMITDERFINLDGYNNKINELFAVHLMMAALVGMKRVKLWDGNSGVDIKLSTPFIEKLNYSLRFRSITIDSIIVLADAITTGTFEIK